MPQGFHLDNLVRSGTKQPYPITISAEGLARPSLIQLPYHPTRAELRPFPVLKSSSDDQPVSLHNNRIEARWHSFLQKYCEFN